MECEDYAVGSPEDLALSNERWRRRFDPPAPINPIGEANSEIRKAYEKGRLDERGLLLPIIERLAGFRDFNVGCVEIKQTQVRGKYCVFWGNDMQAKNGSLGQAIDYCASSFARSYQDKVFDLSTGKRGLSDDCRKQRFARFAWSE